MNADISLNKGDLSKLFKKLTATSKREVLIKTLNFMGIHLAGWVKENRLVGPRPEFLGVVTGRLLGSISSSGVKEEVGVFGREYIVQIGTNVKYAPKHEFGLGVRKRPFLQPALEDRDNQVFLIDTLTKNINEAIKTA